MPWATDIHLDHATESARRWFCQAISEQADALVVMGDIAESHSHSLSTTFMVMDALVDKLIDFVLGDHDYYRGSVMGTQSAVAEIVRGSQKLTYLTQAGVVELSPRTALIGHNGWADEGLELTAEDRGRGGGVKKNLVTRWQSHNFRG